MKSYRLSVLALGLALMAAAAAQAQLRAPASPAAPEARPAASAAPSPADMEKSGQLAAQGWLLLLDRKDWGTAWDASSTVFRQNVPLSAWMEGVPKLREPFGRFGEREVVGAQYKTTLAGRPDGDYVTTIFTSKFEKQAPVEETVTTVREPDGRWRVTGYTAR